ncbi:hypothetical protein CXF85_08060 [Colwellia sp. 75C3]|uniref:hypothetical protein n=1 Tax=Colwellia sp. 75C3 TaxID=888425 RepID=UPI000C3347E9|nr:hypothetical protein [Colwellia sp. 75C3]PKG84552.1 hypothetical protein CXF85_08060 [Colwellia sp. 75C3]
MLNKINMSNRRMIMSAEMLNVYQQDANKTSRNDESANECSKQNIDALYEPDDNAIYELGYN